MKKITIPFLTLTVFMFNANAQTPTSATSSVSKKLGLYIFPAKGQNAETQQKDEADCYKWGVEQSGVDPINPPKVDTAKVETGPDGSMIVGGAKGAAAGAAIGAIAGDAGKGAAIGAVAGGLGGRRAGKAGQQQAQKQANATATQQQQANMDSFKKAYMACLEAKGYTVK